MEDLKSIPILADHRERRSSLMALLATDRGFNLHTAVLPVGDYLLDGQMLIERKTLTDLVASIRDGRLFAQASRLAGAGCPQVAMLLEGTGRDLGGRAIRREAVQGAIINLSMFFGLPILRSRSPRETLWVFRCLFHQHRALVSGALPRKGRRPRGKRALQYHFLQGLPHVGPQRARALLTSVVSRLFFWLMRRRCSRCPASAVIRPVLFGGCWGEGGKEASRVWPGVLDRERP